MNEQAHNTMMNNVRPAVTVQNPPSCTITQRVAYDTPEWDNGNTCPDCGQPTHRGYGECGPSIVGIDCMDAERCNDGWTT